MLRLTAACESLDDEHASAAAGAWTREHARFIDRCRLGRIGLFANGNRAANIAKARELLAVPARSEPPETPEAPTADQPRMLPRPCTCCGGRMFIIETFARGCEPKHRSTPTPGGIRIDTS